MLNHAIVDQWLEEYCARVLHLFGERAVFIGCQGSWARGEGSADSDIDAVTVLDRIGTVDLAAYRDLIREMPYSDKACGLFWSLEELQYHEPRCEVVHLYYGTKTLHGTMDSITDAPTDADLVAEIRFRMGNALHAARHYLVFPHDISVKVDHLYSEYKYALISLRWWILLTTSVYRARTSDLVTALSNPYDKEVAQVSLHWKELAQDRSLRPLFYIELLEQWARSLLKRLIETA